MSSFKTSRQISINCLSLLIKLSVGHLFFHLWMNNLRNKHKWNHRQNQWIWQRVDEILNGSHWQNFVEVKGLALLEINTLTGNSNEFFIFLMTQNFLKKYLFEMLSTFYHFQELKFTILVKLKKLLIRIFKIFSEKNFKLW